jgi:tripartite-type tricarboxylate transporter receptor subunit TctC
MLGVTGDQTVNNVAPLVTQGFPKALAQMNVPAQLVVPGDMPDNMFKQYREILIKAAATEAVQKSFAMDYCRPLHQMPDDQIQPYYNMQVSAWQKLSNGVSLK